MSPSTDIWLLACDVLTIAIFVRRCVDQAVQVVPSPDKSLGTNWEVAGEQVIRPISG